jgi:hypothetical protein
MSLATLLPVADVAVGNWQTSDALNVNYYSYIDEGTTSPSDADYIYTVTDSDIYKATLNNLPAGIWTIASVTIKVRAQHLNKAGRAFNTQLFQSDGTTALTAKTPDQTTTSSFTTYSLSTTLTGSIASADWQNAVLVIYGNVGTAELDVSAVQVEVTYQLAEDGGNDPGEQMMGASCGM